MNRSSAFLLFLLLFTGCASSLKTAGPSSTLRYVSFDAPDFILESSTDLFSDQTLKVQLDQQYVSKLGDRLLQQVIIGYGDQTEAFRYTNQKEFDVQFIIRKVKVSRGLFTLNFPHPGPIYKVKMYVELIENGQLAQSVILKQRVNMSEINFPKERFKWMTPDERALSEYQQQTFRVAIRKLYQQLYLTYFDISLQL